MILGGAARVCALAAALSVVCLAQPVLSQGRSAAQPDAPVVPRTRVVGGVAVREHEAGAFARARQLVLDPRPVTVIGGTNADPAYDLTWARYAVPLRDGRIVTLSPVGNKLFVWGADGRPQRTIGRQGQGPGEWMNPIGMTTLAGDTVFIPDAANRRLNWVLPDRGVVISQGSIEAFKIGFEQLAGVLPGRRVVFSAPVRRLPSDTNTRSLAAITIAPMNGGSAREIARVPDRETRVAETRFHGVARKVQWPLGFSRGAHVVVWDTLVATASGEGYRIELRNTAGRVVSVIQVPVARRQVTTSMRAAVIAAQMRILEGPHSEDPVDPAESKRMIREQPFADSLPPYDRLYVTPDKTLWVVDAIAPTDTGWSATAFRTDGAIIGRLHAQGKSTPVAFGDDRVVMRSEDQDGVVSLSVYHITTRSPQ